MARDERQREERPRAEVVTKYLVETEIRVGGRMLYCPPKFD